MKIVTDAHFGRMVQEYRELRGLSKTEFASKLREVGLTNFHPTTVTRLEKGERPAKLGEASVIAKVLDASLDDLVTVPWEPWEYITKDAEEYGDRAEDYAVWSAFWAVSYEGWKATAREKIDALSDALSAGDIPSGEIGAATELLSRIERQLGADRIAYWKSHVLGLNDDEREEFFKQRVRV